VQRNLRKAQHDEFHGAVRSTGQTLDTLARRVQGDVQHGTTPELLKAQPNGRTSSIEHEIRKSSMYTDLSSRLNPYGASSRQRAAQNNSLNTAAASTSAFRPSSIHRALNEQNSVQQIT